MIAHKNPTDESNTGGQSKKLQYRYPKLRSNVTRY